MYEQLSDLELVRKENEILNRIATASQELKELRAEKASRRQQSLFWPQ